MKPGFSFNDALGAPFVLLRRRPLSLFVWGLMMVAIMAASYSLMIPVFAAIPFGARTTRRRWTPICGRRRGSARLSTA